MRRRAAAVVFSILFVMSVGSAFTPPRASARTPLPITIGYQATADWLLLTARDLQLFEQAGLTPRYVQFVAGAPMMAAARRLGALATFLFDEGVISNPVDVSDATDASVITEALEAWKRSP